MADQPSAPLTIKRIADEWNPSKPGVIMWAAPDGRIEAREDTPVTAPVAPERAAS